MRGFTLLEMMITIAVLVIVVTVAVPAFDGFVANQRVKSAAQGLMTSFSYARSEAIRRNEDVDVQMLQDGGDWVWGVCTDDAVNVPEDCLRVVRTGRVQVAGESPGPVTFDPQGRPNGGGRSVTLCDADESQAVSRRMIYVGITGRSRIDVGDGGCPE